MISEETKEMIALNMTMLKETMKKEGLVFAFGINPKDYNRSKLLIIEKSTSNKLAIELDTLNKGLW